MVREGACKEGIRGGVGGGRWSDGRSDGRAADGGSDGHTTDELFFPFVEGKEYKKRGVWRKIGRK